MPVCKRNFDFGAFSANLCWAPHPEDVFAVGKVIEKKGDSMTVEDSAGTKWTVKAAETYPFEKGDLEDADDMAQLRNLQEATLLDCVRRRYEKDIIYTYTGEILIAVNPFQVLPLYSPEMFAKYQNAPLSSLPPHLFAIADLSYREFIATRHSQSMIISGESGSGKSESTKLILKYLAKVAGRTDQAAGEVSVEARIVESGPLLEAFGNAKTVRNNNSSRFGKFIKVFLNKDAKIIGADIAHYCLEKSRIVFQAKDERNYHCFYQLCAGAPPAWREKYKIGSAKDYKYLNMSGCIQIDGTDDHEEFEITCHSMTTCGISAADQEHAWRLIAAILHMSNLEFANDKSDAASIKDEKAAAFVAELLKVPAPMFIQALTKRTIAVGSERTLIPLKADQASSTRDAFAKAIYGFLFDWLVARVNAALTPPGGSASDFIGVLDIFGFELFQVNSLEQLHINWANEALQQQFNNVIFKMEQKEYQEEQIDWSSVTFQDNEECLQLIEAKTNGILSILDEQCVFPKATDTTFLDKACKTLEKHPYFIKPRIMNGQFGVKHFAGNVMYNVDGFLFKNMDKVGDDLLSLVKAAKDEFLVGIFQPALSVLAEAGKGGKGGSKVTTVSAYFKNQLQNLVKTLNSTDPHYVRCIKPNMQKVPQEFEIKMVQHQLRCAGVLETIRIRKMAYPIRSAHLDFFRHYNMIIDYPGSLDLKGKINHLFSTLNADRTQWQIGKSKVFLRTDLHRELEKMREEKLRKFVLCIQKNVRRHQAQRAYKRTLMAIFRIQLRIRIFLIRMRAKKQIRAQVTFAKYFRRYLARREFKKNRERVILMQKCVRRWFWRRKFRMMKALIKVVQARSRRFIACAKLAKNIKKIIVLQSLWRGKRARKMLKQLREEKKKRNEEMAKKSSAERKKLEEEEKKKREEEAKKQKEMLEKERKKKEEEAKKAEKEAAQKAASPSPSTEPVAAKSAEPAKKKEENKDKPVVIKSTEVPEIEVVKVVSNKTATKQTESGATSLKNSLKNAMIEAAKQTLINKTVSQITAVSDADEIAYCIGCAEKEVAEDPDSIYKSLTDVFVSMVEFHETKVDWHCVANTVLEEHVTSRMKTMRDALKR